jgi:dTDP-4-dehydrorhamnose reductase
VNATAYTAVDKAESDLEQADLINHLAVKHLAEQCKTMNALLIHYSTDYVFDGQGQKHGKKLMKSSSKCLWTYQTSR